MALRKAQTGTTKIDLGDGDYLEVVSGISKGTFNILVSAMPEDVEEGKGLTPKQGTQFQQALFGALVKGWSLDEAPTVAAYLELDQESALQVDAKLVEHFGTLTPDAPKGNEPKTSRSSSRKDTASG